MTGRTREIDYPKVTKRSVALGLALFLFGGLGRGLVQTLGVQLPAWELTLLFDLEVLGIGIFLLSPIVFGVLLPLTE
ncbi:uncharacterized protein Nmlp_3546 [Natronomonas moolapensis 8.8.11]|uniref:MFS transporter n=1 Tax=Natronomonas moolapensis (strain DSM 18674 / CECT 7526 / JCM 14361 / 8.8.11) TaxID=268739 RepID=M1XLG4_NATM8|nr:hypothetical protein [Natronomonas moolapensis]CCQ37670.1 uncharacterized protein Nmlp_3546 [Natronomonas moolapensis 8.8.11]